jgi:hypothetical protein
MGERSFFRNAACFVGVHKHPIMLRTSISVTALAAFAVVSIAQEAPTYKADHRFAYANVVLENNTVKVEMEDVVAEVTYSKFRFKVTNKTNDYVFVDPTKFKVTMGGAAMTFKEKAYMIRPYEKESKTLNVAGGTNYHVDAFTIDFADGFQRLPSKGAAATVEEFTLPASKNEVSGGPFTVNLRNLVQETDKTEAKFSVKYTGTAMAIVDPSKVSVKIPAGQQFANAKSKSKPAVLEGGGTEEFTVVAEIPGKVADMQFTTLTVLWNEAMVETTQQPLAVDVANVTVDAAKTAEINK